MPKRYVVKERTVYDVIDTENKDDNAGLVVSHATKQLALDAAAQYEQAAANPPSQ